MKPLTPEEAVRPLAGDDDLWARLWAEVVEEDERREGVARFVKAAAPTWGNRTLPDPD